MKTMRMKSAVTCLLVVFGSASIMLSLQGCFGGDEEEQTLEATPEEGAAQVEEAPATPPVAVEPEPVVAQEEIQPAASEPAKIETPPPVAASTGQKVVMFVKSVNASIRAEPKDDAKVVGKLEKGDHILVFITGEWAQISDGKYVTVSDLSEKPIPRARKKSKWSK